MATAAASRFLLDTNVLLTATAPSRAGFAQATQILRMWPQAGHRLVTCGQVIREYLVVATRPAEQNGLGLGKRDALENVAMLLRRLEVLEEGSNVVTYLRELVERHDIRGKQVHDANLVAIAAIHDVTALVTSNPKDFARFVPALSVIELASVQVP